MEQFSQEKETLEERLASAELYEESQKEQLKDLLQQQVRLTQSLDHVEEQWMELSEELESA